MATEDLQTELRRAVDRLRTTALSALARPGADGRTPADAAYSVAQELADAAARLEGEPARPLPRLGDPVVADQLAVCGADLLALDPPASVAERLRERVAGLRRTDP
ncbi:hypothetical protein EV189_2759 [Motilibacter rhizosphaerae]|uniref:Uncharacterized protein n=1 Tax=Motilibacter rhizosphaerae TaxID=598652 RepID=A0A4Q7NPT5_9ACTN|nr:hypothetical protein [Motilibacter rhizosphaerae]RZS87334.1 hypothetical protein EV189_2759 [Motilibacter rhizosphaerae]